MSGDEQIFIIEIPGKDLATTLFYMQMAIRDFEAGSRTDRAIELRKTYDTLCKQFRSEG